LHRNKVEDFQRKWPEVCFVTDEEHTLNPVKVSGFTKNTVTDAQLMAALQEIIEALGGPIPMGISFLVTRNGSKMINIIFATYLEIAEFMHSFATITVAGHSVDFRPEWESLIHCPSLFQVYALPKTRLVDIDSLMSDLQIPTIETLFKLNNKRDALEFIIVEIRPTGRDSVMSTISGIYPSAVIVPITPEHDILAKKPLPAENISTYEYALQEHARKMARVISTAEDSMKMKAKEIANSATLAINTGQQVDSLQRIVVMLIETVKDLNKKVERQGEILIEATERISQLMEALESGVESPAKKRKKAPKDNQ